MKNFISDFYPMARNYENHFGFFARFFGNRISEPFII